MKHKKVKVREFVGGNRWSIQDGKVIEYGPVKWTEYKLVPEDSSEETTDPPDEQDEDRKSA